MGFERYQHIERFGTSEVSGIEYGKCYVFPKLDGCNCQLWFEDGVVRAGSRNRALAIDEDHLGFYSYALSDAKFREFFYEHPDLRLYGEWLKPHTLKTYRDEAWNRFYVFDVKRQDGSYLSYEEYQPLMEKFGLDYIIPIGIVENGTPERFMDQLQKNLFMIQDGLGIGEGIVIKNYDWKNKYGRITWAKIVSSEFKEKHTGTMGPAVIKECTGPEQKICEKWITSGLVEKEYAKIAVDGWESKMIPRLLNTIYYCLIKEESWNFVKELKNPVIDYKRLQSFCNIRVKQLKSELF